MAKTLNGTQLAMAPQEEDLEELEGLYHDLQEKADKARTDGRVFMLQEYIRMIALISPEIDRIQRRFKRESLASFRKEHKSAKLQALAEIAEAEEKAAADVRAKAAQ